MLDGRASNNRSDAVKFGLAAGTAMGVVVYLISGMHCAPRFPSAAPSAFVSVHPVCLLCSFLLGVASGSTSSVSLAATNAVNRIQTVPQVATNARVGAAPVMTGVTATPVGAMPVHAVNAQQQLSYGAPVYAPAASPVQVLLDARHCKFRFLVTLGESRPVNAMFDWGDSPRNMVCRCVEGESIRDTVVLERLVR